MPHQCKFSPLPRPRITTVFHRARSAGRQEGISILTSYSSNESSNPANPTGDQLAELRLKQWHQNGEALLTFENVRSWINTAGLVLFSPRPQIIASAPTFVEATVGTPTPAATLAQLSQARELLARLVVEGLAVPLNLLGTAQGGTGDTPDFVVSTGVFSYLFTLVGDKLWKQPPASSGALKVSNLAIATYEVLTRRGLMSAYDLATELGKEVTEAAVLRALGELWHHLRVIPLFRQDGAATVWELTTTRFTKQMKAGANAGQPTAISALISLYLGQAAAASEDEIESFLSPLAARSRIREVVHALLSARQIETLSIDGRSMLHISGAPPAFAGQIPEVVEPQPALDTDEATPAEATESGEPRIKKFIPAPRKIGTGYLAKAKPASASKRPEPGARPKTDRERRPFKRPEGTAPRFDKPWNEDKRKQGGWKPARPERERTDNDRREHASGEASSRKPFPRRDRPAGDRDFKRERKPMSSSSAGFRRSESEPRGTGFRRREAEPREERGTGRRSDSASFPAKPRRFADKARDFSRPRPQGDSGPRPQRDFRPRPQGDAAPRGRFGNRSEAGPRSDGPKGGTYRKFTRKPEGEQKREYERPARRFSGKPGETSTERAKPRSFSPKGGKPAGFAGGRGKSAGFSGDRGKSSGFSADRGKPGTGRAGGFAGKKPFSKSKPFSAKKPGSRFGSKPSGRKSPRSGQDGGENA